QRCLQAVLPLDAEKIALVNDDNLRLLKLFAIRVSYLRRETAALRNPQNALGAYGIHQHAQGSHVEVVAINPTQRKAHGRDQIGATADRLRDEYVRTAALRKTAGGFHQGMETAAEATAGDFLDGELVIAEHHGI